MRALIIDDEVTARRDLRSLLSAHPEVTIVGEAALIDDARVLLARDDYDLVFLDINLIGGSGFDLVPDVRPGAKIIFVSAFDQFALRAFEVNALDYLHKPLRVARLAESLSRLTSIAASATSPSSPSPADPQLSALNAQLPALRPTDIVSVKTGPGAMRFVPVAAILTVGSQNNYSELHLANGEHFLVRSTLGYWEERLPATHFLRVHRKTIVNLSRIEGFEHQDHETTLLRLAGLTAPLRARREHWADLRTRLAALGRQF